MKSEIYIISGFLGSGKTTLIKHLINTSYIDKDSIIVENDFGEESVDSAILQNNKIKISTMNDGCICCSLAGDFVRNMIKIIDTYKPKKIFIEPSGVGKLSDIIVACSDIKLIEKAQIKSKISLADAKRCALYHENFGEFFEDQIGFSDCILLTRVEGIDISPAKKIIQKINTLSPMIALPIEKVKGEQIFSIKPITTFLQEIKPHTCSCGCNHHDHDHTHHVNDVFETITIRIENQIQLERINQLSQYMDNGTFGFVARAKGIFKSKKSHFELQYVPKESKIFKSKATGNFICFIGKDLNKQALADFFV